MIDRNFLAADPTLDGKGAAVEDEIDMWCPILGSVHDEDKIMDVCEVRVGGISWNKVEHSPRQGEWSVEVRGAIVGVKLGAPANGGTIRCDVESSHDDWRRLNY